ncbi:MAG: L,D-transpeptidase family protein [Gammaproteobacteria bacterium]
MSHLFMHRLGLSILISFIIVLLTSYSHAANQNLTPTQQLSSIATRNFWQLNDALSFYENAAKQPWPIIPDDPAVLKLGTRNAVVVLLRERLRLTGDLLPENDIGGKRFDSQLEDAVVNFQNRNGLKADGAVGNDTRAELNIPPDIRIKQIAINMQRWANLSDKLGSRFILVNIPEFHMYVFDDNQKVLNMRAIVGKRDLPTPEISSRVTRIVFNPYWNIPPKIAQRDIVPKMLADPGYVYKMHIRAFRQEDDDNSQISPNYINWSRAEENGLNYHLRQDPGPDNALGQVKFEFANTHDVYMHDTPAKSLFDNDIRDLSHGCIRLENPFALVEYLMKDDPKWNDATMQDILDSGTTHYVRVGKPIPIFVTYITAWVDDDGRVNFRDDVYQQDDPEANALTPKTHEEIVEQ